MSTITANPVPEFSEDHRSQYRAELVTMYAEGYAAAQARHAQYPSHLTRLHVDMAHAQLLAAALPPCPERDLWKDRAHGLDAAIDLWHDQRKREGR